MPKNTGLKLFTKTWPLKREKKRKDDENKRPLTATLEKPTILDIRFIAQIDMSRVRKEFLNMSNLCRMPLVIKQKRTENRPLSLLSSEMQRKPKKKRKTIDPSDDSHEDDESSVIQSAKIINSKNVRTSKNSGRIKSNNSVINQLKPNNVLKIKNSLNDANNNKTLKVPSRKTLVNPIPPPIITTTACPEMVKSSTKLPSPCRACGRPDLPERFHSHPLTPLKPSPRGKDVSTLVLEKSQKLTVKSIVQKPVAIKYKSKNGSAEPRSKSPLKKTTNNNQISSLPVAVAKKSSVSIINKNKDSLEKKSELPNRSPSADSKKEEAMNRKSVTPLRGGSGKRTLTCYICAREFGTASLSLHEPKCLEKWERENATLPPNMKRKPPVKPEGITSQKEWNQLAWESSQAALVPCRSCGRTFYPDRLMVHQKSCKVNNNKNLANKKSASNDTLHSTSSSPMSQSSDPPSTSATPKAHQPPSVQCYICGKLFGTHSIKIHEKKCLQKWHAENEALPPDMRSPAPTKQVNSSQSQPAQPPANSSNTTSIRSSKDERPTSGTKSPLFPCYLCGKMFTVNSIYIHEPQCLKMWKIENDKLPPNKRRPVPLKPDIKFTRSGKINFNETSEAYWQSHLSQLVPCKTCSRTFNPDRLTVHERSCKGN